MFEILEIYLPNSSIIMKDDDISKRSTNLIPFYSLLFFKTFICTVMFKTRDLPNVSLSVCCLKKTKKKNGDSIAKKCERFETFVLNCFILLIPILIFVLISF